VEFAERFADGTIGLKEFATTNILAHRRFNEAVVAPKTGEWGELEKLIVRSAVAVTDWDAKKAALETPSLVAQVVRECSRNQDGAAVWEYERRSQAVLLRHIVGNPFHEEKNCPHLPAVIQHALAVYEGNPRAVSVLCDFLWKTGLRSLTNHFEEPDHPQGCWALDCLLGKS